MATNDRERPGKCDREQPRTAANRLTTGLARFWPAIHPHRSLRCSGSRAPRTCAYRRYAGRPMQLEQQLSYAHRPQSVAWGYEQPPPQPAAPDRGTPRRRHTRRPRGAMALD
jgi:hypothetical protein